MYRQGLNNLALEWKAARIRPSVELASRFRGPDGTGPRHDCGALRVGGRPHQVGLVPDALDGKADADLLPAVDAQLGLIEVASGSALFKVVVLVVLCERFRR